ncbi:MAG: hypothetical protein GY894_09270 [Planctomycetes bacterium]|jgi:hypothetical protein|nr:hypothetical protein [Planctomycetota bacterium]MCP4839532.1 hypothetical protein [Planctomycetota bacterium]
MNWRDHILTIPPGPHGWLEGVASDQDRSIEMTTDRLTQTTQPIQGGASTVVWSGGLGTSPFESHPDTWLPQGWLAFLDACVHAPPATLVRPHTSHVISDGLACRRFLEQPEAAHLRLALSPASMLTESMLLDHHDHLIRIFEMTASAASLIILEDLSDGIPCCAGQGDLEGPLLSHLVGLHAPPGVTLIVAAESREEALRWLQ